MIFRIKYVYATVFFDITIHLGPVTRQKKKKSSSWENQKRQTTERKNTAYLSFTKIYVVTVTSNPQIFF